MEALDRVPPAERLEGLRTDRVTALDENDLEDARCTTFRYGRHGLAGIVDRGRGDEPQRHPLLERPPVVGNGDEMPHERLRDPVPPRTASSTSGSEPPRGHQNSSASPLITQSAACSVAARRAIRVTHSRWRNGPSGSDRTQNAACSLVAGQHLGSRPSTRDP